MKRLTAISDVGEAYYPYCYRADTCDGEGGTEKCRDCEFSEKICKTLAAYENTGLPPQEVEKVKYLGPAVDRMQELFGDKLSVDQITTGFVEFYLAEQGDRASNAVLLTNEEVEKWRKLKERDEEKAPSVKINDEAVKVGAITFGRGTKAYRCPSCKRLVIYRDRFCRDCGQRLKWEKQENA